MVNATRPKKNTTVAVREKKKPARPGVAPRAIAAFTRLKLVGKFPEIQHLPAPSAQRQLDDEKRRQLLSAMVLA